MPVNYSQLKTEIQNPFYSNWITSGNHVAIANYLNVVNTGIIIQRKLVPTYEIFEAIVPSELFGSGVTSQERARLDTLLGLGNVDAQGANTKQAFLSIFPQGTTTRQNLIALARRTGSRAEELFGIGTVVRHQDIAIALLEV